MASAESVETRPAREAYAARLADRIAEADAVLAEYHRRTRSWQTARVLLAAPIGGAIFQNQFDVLALFVSVGGAVGMMVFRLLANRAARRWRAVRRSVGYYECRLRHLDGGWTEDGDGGPHYAPADHPFAADLDLFGPRSLFQRVCSARRRAGRDALADWLLQPPPPDAIRERQSAVRALVGRVDLREALDRTACESASRDDPAALVAWAEQRPRSGFENPRVMAWLLDAAVAVGVVSVALGYGPTVLFAAFVVQAGFAYFTRGVVRAILGDVEPRTESVTAYADLFRAVGGPAARPFDELSRHLNRLWWVPVLGPLLGTTHVALAIEAWRSRHGASLRGWLVDAGRHDALASLAGYAYEHAGDPFPEIVDGGPVFEGVGLRHPLLPRDRCVPNDLALGADARLVIVSGSNMSGKSTLMRTVGANAVLALAGAPVAAERLRVSPLTFGATLRVQDSLLDGRSRFGAEVARLRRILDALDGPTPLLFLLDELFSGTNSEDRRVGAEAVLTKLVSGGAVGLVTTHDLALTAVAERLGPVAANVHFADEVKCGQLVFDYQMRPGVVGRSNALAVLRAAGIDV